MTTDGPLQKEVYLKGANPFFRKALAEPVLAPLLEMNLGKEDILFVYLNRVFFGGGAHGVEAAARVYFAKPARDLTLLKSAVLVSLLSTPNRYNPHRSPDLALERAHRVLGQMVEQRHLTQSPSTNLGCGLNGLEQDARWQWRRSCDVDGG